jgi:hypothetical protein
MQLERIRDAAEKGGLLEAYEEPAWKILACIPRALEAPRRNKKFPGPSAINRQEGLIAGRAKGRTHPAIAYQWS